MYAFWIEYWQFIRKKKAYWLVPLILVLILVGTLIVLAQGNVAAPFVYTFF